MTDQINLQLNEKRQVWFASDFHFAHRGIVKGISEWKNGTRDFATQEAHDELILARINAFVEEDDILVFLGDFAFGPKENVEKYRRRINCKNIYLTVGNHDHHIKDHPELHSLFIAVDTMFEFRFTEPNGTGKHLKYHVTACHFAMETWNMSNKGSIMLHGHSHGMTPSSKFKKMDVGIDCNNFMPFNFKSEILPLMANRRNKNHHPHYNLVQKLLIKLVQQFT